MSAMNGAKVFLALIAVTIALPSSVKAQVDQGALARAIRTSDATTALGAFSEARRALAPEQMGAELRAALIAALEHQNQVYRATAEAAMNRDLSGSSSPDLSAFQQEFWGEGYGLLIETVISLRDREAIPALVGGLALFTEQGAVEPLAEFGEDAASSILLIAEGHAWHRWQVEGALATLTLMIEDPRGKPLSRASVERMRQLVRNQLTTGVSYPEMVVDLPFQRASAIEKVMSLALALEDPPLRGLVSQLASDAAAVRRLGIQDPKLVGEVQHHAAEALARARIR